MEVRQRAHEVLSGSCGPTRGQAGGHGEVAGGGECVGVGGGRAQQQGSDDQDARARVTGAKLFRKLVGVPAGEIRLRRSKATKDGDNETVSDTVAVTLRPTKEGDGVEIDGMAKVKAIDVQDKVSTKDLEVTQNATFRGKNDQNVGITTVVIDSAGLTLDRSDKNKEGGRLVFGPYTGQVIALHYGDYGIGVQDYTQYFRTKKNFAWYKGGDHNDGELNHGGGVVQMVIKDGNVGIGTAEPDSAHMLTSHRRSQGRRP